MKTAIIILSTLFAFFVFVPQQAFSQESNTTNKSLTKKLEKEKKKQEKEAAAQADRQKYAEMLQNKHFVFMANTLSGDAGRSFSVTPKFNFLKVEGKYVVFQFAFDGIVGWNGIGGITMKGEIDDYRFDPGKNIKKPMRVTMRISGDAFYGDPYVTLAVFEEGYASITISINKFVPINMSGQVIPLEDSGVYEGQETIIVR